MDELVELAFTATATDADLPANTLTFSLGSTGARGGMTIDANTGAFTWTPTRTAGTWCLPGHRYRHATGR